MWREQPWVISIVACFHSVKHCAMRTCRSVFPIATVVWTSVTGCKSPCESERTQTHWPKTTQVCRGTK